MNNYPQLNGNNPFRIFDYKNLGGVRIRVLEDGQPIFCLSDVCRILDIKNSRNPIKRMYDPGVYSMDIGVQTGVRSDGTAATQKISMTFIDLGNLFELVLGSRKPEAKEFSHWVKYTVLPSILYTGTYSIENDPTLSPEAKLLFSHDKKINVLQDQYCNMNEELSCLSMEVSSNDMRITELEDRQRYLIEDGSHTILQFSQYCNLNLSEVEKQRLGKKATSICKRNGLFMGSAKAGRFIAHTYPYPVLVEVFQEYLKSKSN